MKNLESFVVQALDAGEIKETDGGFLKLLGCAILLLATSYTGGCGGTKGPIYQGNL